MKLDAPFELRQPIVVSLVRGVVIKDDVDLRVLRLVGQHAIHKAWQKKRGGGNWGAFLMACYRLRST